jgi:hypothetical protein
MMLQLRNWGDKDRFYTPNFPADFPRAQSGLNPSPMLASGVLEAGTQPMADTYRAPQSILLFAAGLPQAQGATQ